MTIRPFAALIVAGAISACSSTKGTAVTATAASFADSADQVFNRVQAPFESNGVKRGTLYADTMYVMNDQTRFDFIKGRVEFNTELGKYDGTMSADRGRNDQRTTIPEGWGNVFVKSADGRSLKSPHIVYDARSDKISSDTTFELIAEGRVTTGVG